MAIITTVPVSTSAFAIHGFMAEHRPFHTILRRRQSVSVRLTRCRPDSLRTSTTRSYSLVVGWPGKQPNGEHALRATLSYGQRELWQILSFQTTPRMLAANSAFHQQSGWPARLRRYGRSLPSFKRSALAG